jgi:endothelin-converting enzyme/putative endopeptidase
MPQTLDVVKRPVYLVIAAGILGLTACSLQGTGETAPAVSPSAPKARPEFFTPADPPETALIDPSAIDPNTNPCDDFYQYACGGWIRTFKLPDDQSIYTRSFDVINNRNIEIERDILKAYAAGDFRLPAKYARKLGEFYATCMDTSHLEQDTLEFINRALPKIDAVTDKSGLSALVARLHLEGTNILFGFGPDSDAKDSNQEIAEFSQGGMGLPNNTYYIDAPNADARARYLLHVTNILKLAGFDENRAHAAALSVMKIESELARSALRPEDLMNPKITFNPTDLAGLRADLPAFDVDSYLREIGLGAKPRKINVTEPKFMKAVNNILTERSLDEIKVYFKWQVLHAAASSLNDDFQNEHFAFNNAYLSGAKKIQERWKRCVSATENAMGEALGEAYVNKTFGREGKSRALEMISQIRTAFAGNLAEVDWLDEATRTQAAKKLDKLIAKIGYPDRFRNYDRLQTSDSLIENVINGAVFESRRQIGWIGKPVDKSLWSMYPQTVNAYYNANWNEIVFPAGILQSPFFSKDASDGANYGAIGTVMGHELTHGFDSSGRQYDGDGNLIDWWSMESSQAFDSKSQCLVEQYNRYEVIPGVHLNGRQTLTENIADLGGVKLAYRAYLSVSKNRPPMPPVAGFDENKQFFVALAQSWCTVQTPETAKLLAQIDTHSDSKYRVNGSLANTPAFARAFNCSVDSAMTPRNRCSLW